jgi:hypothetical protein
MPKENAEPPESPVEVVEEDATLAERLDSLEARHESLRNWAEVVMGKVGTWVGVKLPPVPSE